MAHYENGELNASFDLPDNPTARQVLAYDSAMIEYRDEPALVLLWECARTIIGNWQSEHMPQMDTSLDSVTGLKAAQVIEWAGAQVSFWRIGLNDVPKN